MLRIDLAVSAAVTILEARQSGPFFESGGARERRPTVWGVAVIDNLGHGRVVVMVRSPEMSVSGGRPFLTRFVNYPISGVSVKSSRGGSSLGTFLTTPVTLKKLFFCV